MAQRPRPATSRSIRPSVPELGGGLSVSVCDIAIPSLDNDRGDRKTHTERYEAAKRRPDKDLTAADAASASPIS
jgi:hypothetical protein